MTALKLYGCPNTRSLRAAWALEEAGAAYEYVLVDLFKGAGRAPKFLALNPAGKVPLLVDGDLTLTESAAIVAHIGDKFPASGLMPRAAAARADCLRRMFFATTELEQPLWTIAKHRFALPKDKRVAGIEETARWEFSITATLLAEDLGEREFICGNAFTGADILLGHTLAWARSAKIELEPPELTAYLERLLARPALARARAREAGKTPAA
ncbi:MAG: glutathione S-transferase family protein [Burkholderiales bacterium]